MVDEGDWNGGPHPASAGFEILLRGAGTDEDLYLLEKFKEIPGEFDLWQFARAVRLYIDKLRGNRPAIAPGTKVIMKVIGPWEAFESQILTLLKKEGLERISKVIHSNRGEGNLVFNKSIGGQGFLTIMTESSIPAWLTKNLYIVFQELKIQRERQWEKQDGYHTQSWFNKIDKHIEDYNTRKLAERFDHLKIDRFSTYYAKFQDKFNDNS